MRKLKMLNLALLIVLSIASGLAKITLMPQEIEFFELAGLSETLMVLFGVLQLAGGIFLGSKDFRMLGAIIMVVTFSISTVLIFLHGNIAFGLFSILPILMLGVVIENNQRKRK